MKPRKKRPFLKMKHFLSGKVYKEKKRICRVHMRFSLRSDAPHTQKSLVKLSVDKLTIPDFITLN